LETHVSACHEPDGLDKLLVDWFTEASGDPLYYIPIGGLTQYPQQDQSSAMIAREPSLTSSSIEHLRTTLLIFYLSLMCFNRSVGEGNFLNLMHI